MQILKVKLELSKFSDIELGWDRDESLGLSQDTDKVYVHKNDLANLIKALEVMHNATKQ